MPFRPEKKTTLLMPSGPANDPSRKHLWIILTDPCPMNAHLLVNVTTVHEGHFHDPACVLKAGDHRRIKHPSWMEYRRCRVELTSALEKGHAAWYYHADEPVSDDVLKRICDGLLNSEHTPGRIRNYFLGKGPAY